MSYRSQARNKLTGEVVMRQRKEQPGRPMTHSEAMVAAELLADNQNKKDSRPKSDWVAEVVEWNQADSGHKENAGRPRYTGAKPRATFTWKE